MHGIGNGKAKCRDFGVELDTVGGDHLIRSMHGAHRCFNDGGAGVGEFFTGFECRLFPYDAVATNLFGFAI